MSHADTILTAIHDSGGLTNSEIVRRTGIQPHQQVRPVCRLLVREERIVREIGPRRHVPETYAAVLDLIKHRIRSTGEERRRGVTR